jgi:hypothetical protein
MRDKDDETRIKAYMQAKMTHIKMYNECMNLADGLDVAKFAELVRADEREQCAKVCDEILEHTKKLGNEDAVFTAISCAVAILARGEK